MYTLIKFGSGYTNLVSGVIDNVPTSANSLSLIALDPGCNGASFTVDLVYPVNSMQIVRASSTIMKLRLTFQVPSNLGITGIKTVSNGLVGGQVVWENSNTIQRLVIKVVSVLPQTATSSWDGK